MWSPAFSPLAVYSESCCSPTAAPAAAAIITSIITTITIAGVTTNPPTPSSYDLFRQWLPTLAIGVLPDASDAMAMYDEQYTWKPLLTRLASCDDAKLLTMLRIDATVSAPYLYR